MKRPVKFGDYYLFERVAVGGMAEVFKAMSYGVEAFERVFAIKRVLPQIAEDQEFIDMFIDEAKIAVQLAHANIGQVFELGNAEDSYFIAMEFVSGKDTRCVYDRIRSRGERLNIAMCCHIVKEVCEALEYAHNKRNETGDPLNLIHRDVSPQNIIVSYEGEVKLIDFGIAKAAGKANKTQVGILKGKFGYMSPEQVRGKPIDGRSDVFSLATVLYELLTLERCFQGSDDFSTLEKVRKVDFRRPTLLNRAIPPELERIVYRGLTRNPSDRFQSAADFQDALQKFLYQSGSFYSRKDLSVFMKDTFARELKAENERTASFRDYAQKNIAEARLKSSIPEAVISMDSILESAAFDVSEVVISESSTDTDLEMLVIDRTTDDTAQSVVDSSRSAPARKRQGAFEMGNDGHFPSDAETIPRETGRRETVKTKSDTTRRLTWLAIVTVFALVAGGVTIMHAIQTFTPGSLTIQANVKAGQIYVNSRLRHEGQLPFEIKQLSAGKYTITLQSKGFNAKTEVLELASGEQKQLRLRLRSSVPKTSIALETIPPGATVYIDGKKVDETPLSIAEIKPGRHDLRIEKSDYAPYQATINLEPGTSGRVDPIRLYPVRVTITLIAEPSEAEIAVKLPDKQWKTLGKSPQKLTDVNNSGRIQIRVTAADYVSLDHLLPRVTNLRHQEILNLEAQPTAEKAPPKPRNVTKKVTRRTQEKANAKNKTTDEPQNPSFCRSKPNERPTLYVSSIPKARVFIDGRELGWAPVLNHQVVPGHHAVLLVRQQPPEFRDSFSVYVTDSQEMRCIYRGKQIKNER